MEIQQRHTDTRGSFYVEEDGKTLAEMTYTMAPPGKFIIQHTEVDDVLRGKNVGMQMLKAAVDYARENELKIIPLCPFAKSVFDRKEEIRDVLA